ncbi:MAG: helix-turn-helix transcriptional regulator [Pseudonocardiales bacterium]|nr:helix-turn-helix transcriptional regulator [Pseudonocardiales bacterium]MBV9652777.1 helix-turn-helix transcriptional regulator [Pseudonocardiales bacterium]
MPAMWPLTGRAEELSVINGLTRRQAGTAGVVLAGAAGVGKTRLAREALAIAKQRGALTRWVVATASARTLPLGAFAATLGVVGPDPARLMRQASAALLAGAGEGGVGSVIIGVDDAHLLDELSATLVHQLMLRRAASVVLTLRSGETAPDAVTALWKEGHLSRLELQPLSQNETTTLLEAALGGAIDSIAARRLWSITRGNVLYLRHLVDGELEAGRLHQVEGLWLWSGTPKLSPGLADLLSARIGQLPDPVKAVIEMLAFGEPLGVPLLAGLTDAVAVEQAEARALVEVYPDRRRLQARLAHPLYGELQRAQVGTLHARRLCGRLAGALAGTGERRAGDTLRRALLTLESDLPPDPALLTKAAQRATELGDLALAEQLARAAIAAGGGFEPRLLLGNALHYSGPPRAEETESELAAVAAMARTDVQRVLAAQPRAANLVFGLARPAEAMAVLDAVAETISDDVTGLELSAMRSILDVFLGRPHHAAEGAAAVLAHSRCTPPAAQLAIWGLVAARGSQGHLDGLAGKVQWIDARADGFETGLHQAAIIGSSWVHGLLLAGLLDAAEDTARRYRERCDGTTGFGYGTVCTMCGAVAQARGQVRTATRWFGEALAASVPTFTLPVDPHGALGMAGDAASARDAWRRIAPTAEHPGFAHIKPELQLGRAWMAAAEGSISEAIALARQAAQLAASQGHPAVEVVALHVAVCFGDRTVADRLAELATQVDGPRAPAAAAHAAALAADDGAALQAASLQLETMGALLLAADADAQAATAHHRHGQRGSAQAATSRAHRLAQACEGARTPALTALAAPLPLTAREREIVTLAASGLSNRQIADKLTVSVRTVEGHLYRACAKLGVGDRTKLAALIHGD